MDGKPWAHAGVVFQPVDGRGRQSMGVTDAEGNYELRYLRDVMGAAVGAHTVRITTQRSNDPATETTPACYNSQTTLTAEIKAGKNENCDFALQSQH